MKKQIAALGLCAAMVVGSATGCSTASSTETAKAPAADTTTAAGGQADTTAAPETEAAKADLKGSLVFAIWDNNLMDYIDQNDMVGKFQEKYPDAEIEVETVSYTHLDVYKRQGEEWRRTVGQESSLKQQVKKKLMEYIQSCLLYTSRGGFKT